MIRPTRAFTLVLDGTPFDEWTAAEVTRDIEDMTGSFRFELRDGARNWAAFPFASLGRYGNKVALGLEAKVYVSGELVLVGWVDTLSPAAGQDGARVSIAGSDKARDLIDGAATVEGPSEFRRKTMDEIGREVVRPYGLEWRSEVDVGEPFERYVLEPGETALSALEKGLRQRGGLLTSDGVGGLVVTRTGARRAPSPLKFPGNLLGSSGEFSAEGRHSEYHVKGQAEAAGGKRRKRAKHNAKQSPLDSTAQPLFARTLPAPGMNHPAWIDAQLEHEMAGVGIWGRARDEEMRRYRPLVTLGRTQLTDDGAQCQAEWMERTSRGSAESLEYEVKGYRGENGQLWRPNEISAVSDAFLDVERDMLVAGVTYRYSEDGGEVTALRVTSPDAYDREPVGERRTNRQGQRKGRKRASSGPSGPLDSTARPL